MIDDFEVPQRQSKVGIVVMFFYTLQQYARALFPLLVIWILKIDEINKLYLALGIITAILAIAVVAYLQYRNFTFFLDRVNREFIISEGIFNRSETVIQLNKIQQVNITQSLIQRLINVYGVDVDTAGSTKKEGNIRAVSHTTALALKARLLEQHPVIALNEDSDQRLEADNHAPPLLEVSFLTLLKVGITSNYLRSLGLILAFFATVYENVHNYSRYSNPDNNWDDYFGQQLTLASVPVLIGLLFIAVLIINVIRTTIKYMNYKIIPQGRSLLLSYGLINTKSTILKPEKVQLIALSQNYFQKKLNLVELGIKQATSGEKEDQKSAIEIPGCSSVERDQILKLLFNVIPQKGEVLTPNFRKLIFSVFTMIVVPLILFFGASQVIDQRILDYNYVIVGYSLLVGIVLYFSFRNYRLFISDGFIMKQSGAWDITTEVLEIGKIQALSTSQLFWHKRNDIGTLTIHTAGGDIAFDMGNFSKIKQYVNLWLYELERSDSNWM